MNTLKIVVLMVLVACGAARAEERIALVVGNGAYAGLGALINPVADARLVGATLTSLGFNVTMVLDSDLTVMKTQIAEFGRRLRASGSDAVGLFYYAGHGVQSDGRNYLIPVDAVLTDAADLDLVGVEANWVLRQMESAGNDTNIIILDACRNNPFVAATRSLASGLARLDAPTGSFIAYATAPGAVAYDGASGNSPFSAALARAMPIPNLAIEQMFKQVRLDVIRETGGRQTPWDSSSLVTEFAFSGTPGALDATPLEVSMWETAEASRDPGKLALFLQMYPSSPYSGAARSLLSEVLLTDSGPASTAAPPPEPVAPVAPTPEEMQLIGTAQASGELADYLAYLEAYPQGSFAELADAEIGRIEASTALAAAAGPEAPEPPAPDPVVAEPVAVAPSGPVRYDQPLSSGPDGVLGRTIAQLIESTPLEAPIEGLDPSIWQNRQCTTCHAWTEATLCEQGARYVAAGDAAVTRLSHPFGGAFKSRLRDWARDGCQ